jgi:FKBP-type peptidyl-prolyl cis-trans isomerase FkpA
MKYKSLLFLALIVIFAANCDPDEPIEYFDHVGQEVIDNDSLVEYMQTHYLDADGELKLITSGQTPIYDQVTTQVVHHKWDYEDDSEDVEIDYKLYYYIISEGTTQNPTKVDSAHISYKGILLDHSVFDQNDYGVWMPLNSVVKGMSQAMVHFKAGDWVTNSDGSFTFSNGGKGIIFMPSGLGYANVYQTKIPTSSPLIFYVNLNLIRKTDWDGDGILSMYEDVNNNGDYTDDDTDDDTYYNYYDADDDGDGTLTKNENADPNDDGNPSDALDSNTNGIPDYLDELTK